MRQVDDRFLSVHPRTALWWEQRKLCQRCVHLDHVGSMMWCTVTRRHNADASCITAREVGPGRCGPEARLFKEFK